MRVSGDFLEPSVGNKIEVPSGFAIGTSGTERLRISDNGVYSAGSVVQVVSVTKSDTFTSTSASFVDITGLSATITPKSTSSKILVIGFTHIGRSIDIRIESQLVRDSTPISIATGGSNNASSGNYMSNIGIGTQVAPMVFNFLDSPSTTSATTYKIQGKADSVNTWWVNRNALDSLRTISTLTLMEIGG